MLYQAGTTPAKVAQDLGVTAALISRVINEETVSARVTQRLEQILNKPWADIVAEARAVADRRGASAA
jgi:transcriptional regulator with XRE-family HTH domain